MQRTSPLVNYAGGLLSKKLFGRIDLASYPLGMSVARNFLAEVQGPQTFRMGSRYVLPTRLNGQTSLYPFVFNDEQAYVLAFSEGKFRVFADGGAITETAKTITGATKANPGVITSVTHGYATGDQIYISGVVGMTQLNDKFFLVVRIDPDTYSLKTLDGVAVDTSAYTTYTSGGATERVYEVTAPYVDEDLVQP